MSSSTDDAGTTTHSLQEFKLFETQSNFYMIGWDGSGVYRVLKIDRLDPSELNISQDSTHYTKKECYELLKRIHEGNKATGGLKLVTLCYGIIGFVKFLGPYYMLLITERRHIGDLFGHSVYAVSKSEIVALHNSTVQCNFANSRDENRYKRLLCMVDLTKDFFFSYSYNVMRSYQKNVCNYETGHNLYEKMFVWNEFLTRGIRHHLRNTLWTVALVYGFFKQASLSESGKDFKITLIARRSRHNAGTRYLKRGVNRNGDVANDVETEQIVSEDVPEDHPMQISSVVQNRGSIPLFWSQETSRLNLKPDIVLSKKEPNYEATRLHFDNLVERYGNPIIILNLIKTKERRPRESILREEFVNAIDFINKDLPEENRLRFLHWDLHKHFRSKTKNVLALLCKVATCALMLTDLFYYQVTPAMTIEDSMSLSSSSDADTGDISPHTSSDDDNGDHDSLEKKSSRSKNIAYGKCDVKPPRLQSGVLRTNCIDCLDRTNVAQYAYGWAALGQQLHVLGIRDVPAIELDDPLAISLMGLYERMGDTLAHQYGGSAAHNKVFSERRGQWRAATQSQEFLRTLQRYYNNAYMDADKQDAINIFLGTFQPEQGMPAIWELRSNSLSNGRNGEMNIGKDERFLVKRCLSDGDFLHESCTPLSAMSSNHESMPQKGFSAPLQHVSENMVYNIFKLSLIAGALAVPIEALEKRACPGVHVFGARETTASAGYGSSSTVVNGLLSAYSGSTAEAISYPACGGQASCGSVSYSSSVSQGIAAVASAVNAYNKECPSTKLVLVGYSQGAEIIDAALCGGGVPNQGYTNTAVQLSTSAVDMVKAAIFMGDPLFKAGLPYNVGTCAAGGFDARPAGFSCPSANKIQSYCDASDPYCCNGSNAATHNGYGSEYGSQALTFVKGKLA